MPTFGLVDCNNFYASCERVFNPRLEGRPVVILSNNDGCIIARSNEAKQLGIPMGAPYYRWRKLCEENGVHVFSSNYELYGDMSQRIMQILAEMCPDIEIYSIDEAFLRVESFNQQDIIKYAKHIRETIKRCTGIPVSIGIAPSKTLSKVANHIAKKQRRNGVFDLRNTKMQEAVLSQFAVDNIWGIGRRLSEQLNTMNIYTAKELRDSDPKAMRRRFSVVMEKTIQELGGISCLSLESIKARKQIISSRSFGRWVTALEEIEEALSCYTNTACQKLREQGSVAGGVSVFLHTNLFSEKGIRYHNNASCLFENPTGDTRHIISAAKKCLRSIYKFGLQYKKTGIVLLDLSPKQYQQQDFFSAQVAEENDLLMQTVDSINRKLGKNTVFYCAEGTTRPWQMRSDLRTPRYTTRWGELLEVKIAGDVKPFSTSSC